MTRSRQGGGPAPPEKVAMWILTALSAALFFGICTVFFKVNAARANSLNTFLCGLYLGGAAGFAIIARETGPWPLDFSYMTAAMVVAIGSAGGNWLFSRALDVGPVSLTSPLINLNAVYVVLLSVVCYGESLGPTEAVCISLLFASICILPIDPDEKRTIQNRRWYGLVLLAGAVFALRNGGLKVTAELGLQNTVVLLYAYVGSFCWFGVGAVRQKKRQRTGPSLGLGLVAGLFSFGGLQAYAHALQQGPASIVAPIFATYSLVAGLLSILLLKERPSRLQWAALMLFVSALVTLKAA